MAAILSAPLSAAGSPPHLSLPSTGTEIVTAMPGDRRLPRIPFVLAGALVLTAALLRGLRLWTSGRPIPFLDESGHPLEGSISEKIHVDINDVKQGMFIKGRDIKNPVLLYLHGGMPEYFLTERYPTPLEELFTVCWWEQRGAGLSYSPHIPRKTMTLEQFIADTLAVTNYLRDRFAQEKIYLMAHSGGTFFGIQAAARAPELYRAYIGMSQMVNQLESEHLAYEYMLQRFRETGKRRMVRQLEAAPVATAGGIPLAYLALRDKAMHALGIGTTHDMRSVVIDIFWCSLRSRKYSLGEKINLWRGKFATGVTPLWDAALNTDLAKQVTVVKVPVYFLHGVNDYTCSYPLARAYFETLQGPLKGFYTFEQSAHSPVFEEPERARRILQEDVLGERTELADAR